MTLKQLQDLIAEKNITKLKEVFSLNYDISKVTQALLEYDPKLHDVHDPVKRKDVPIIKENDNGVKETIGMYIKTRISVPIEENIVMLRSAFIGVPVMDATEGNDLEKELLIILKKIEKDNKLEFKFTDVTKKTMSELSCAELWFTQIADPDYWKGYPITSLRRQRVKILAHTYGDTLYPVFDDYGDMIAFGRGYETKDDEGKKTDHFDVYTAERFLFYERNDAGEYDVNIFEDNDDLNIKGDNLPGIPNQIGKIPVMYYSQKLTEWDHVSEMIRRIETKISNHAETNDAFDSPIFFGSGKIEGFVDRGETAKVLQGENGADGKFLTWDSAPESTRMELENLFGLISEHTQTPKISFDQMKGLGAFSKIALEMFFIAPRLKANDKRLHFGEIVQRRYNYLKKAVSVMDKRFEPALTYEISPKFEYFMPNNDTETMDTLIKAYEAGTISLKTLLQQSPLVQNAEDELKLIDAEAKAKAITNPPPVPADPNNPNDNA